MNNIKALTTVSRLEDLFKTLNGLSQIVLDRSMYFSDDDVLMDDILEINKETISLYEQMIKNPDDEIISRIRNINTDRIFMLVMTNHFAKYKNKMVHFIEFIVRIKNIETKGGSEVKPESFNFNIPDEKLTKAYDEFKSYIFKENNPPERCYFDYAIRGDQIPTEKLPYKPMIVRSRSIGTLGKVLIELQQVNNPDFKTLQRENKRKSTKLFKNIKGEYIKAPGN
jgi:hypothetical protein